MHADQSCAASGGAAEEVKPPPRAVEPRRSSGGALLGGCIGAGKQRPPHALVRRCPIHHMTLLDAPASHMEARVGTAFAMHEQSNLTILRPRVQTELRRGLSVVVKSAQHVVAKPEVYKVAISSNEFEFMLLGQ